VGLTALIDLLLVLLHLVLIHIVWVLVVVLQERGSCGDGEIE
jgi:hypothetical protein